MICRANKLCGACVSQGVRLKIAKLFRYPFTTLQTVLILFADFAPLLGQYRGDVRWIFVGLAALAGYIALMHLARREFSASQGAASRLYLLSSQWYVIVFALYFAASGLGGIYKQWFVSLFALQILLLGVVFLLIKQQFSLTRHIRAERADRLAHLKAQGIYPAPGLGSDDDVCRLAQNPDTRLYAVRLHRELHGGALRDATRAVKKLR